MASIVKLLPGSKSLITLTDSMASIKLVRSEIFRSKRTYKDIANGAGVANSTVANIASEKTHWPRLETIIRVLGSLGWVITAQRRD
jgi:transcriptional regulator with XRE-family HTH domain